MNQSMNQRRYGLLTVLLCAALLVLQGCGGDDAGSGISQDMYDALQADYDQAVTDRDAAMAGQATADAAAMAAMEAQGMADAAQTAAEAAQAAAELRRDAAIAAQAVAEAAAAAAMEAEMEAEAAEMAAVTAKEMAEAEAAATNLDVAAAEAAQAIAVAAQTAAEDARDAAMTARMTAEAAQEVAEDERDAAVMAQTAAETARDAAMTAETAAVAAQKAAETAKMTAETERDAANTARMTAETERDAALAARKVAEDKLAEIEMDMEDEMTAEEVQRARVDARAIQASAGGKTSRRNTLTGALITSGVKTNTVSMYQGSDRVPGSDPTGDGKTRATNGEMTLTATRVGDTVTFMATADANNTDSVAGMTLINFDATADGDMTSAMTAVDLSGGLTKHIYLMSDVMAPLSRSFAGNVPAGLNDTPGFDTASQTYQYGIDDNWYYVAPGDTDPGNRPSVAADAATATGINLDRHAAINIDLGAFEPTSASPMRELQEGGALMGYYAGVPGSFRCEAGVLEAGCSLVKNADGEVFVNGTWQFVPSADPVAIADSNYHVYGAWLKKPDSTVGTGVSAAIASGSDLFDADADNDATNGNDAPNNIAGLMGSATYSGSAAGFYAERHVDSEGATSGTFRATASLTAVFDDSAPDGADNVGNISGMVTDFMRDDETAVEVDWVLTLGMINLDAVSGGDDPATAAEETDFGFNAGVMPNEAGGFVAGRTSGTASGAPWAGEWGVQFTGNGGDADQHPGGVVGTFGAQHGSAELVSSTLPTGAVPDSGFVGVIGGFGASKE